MTNTYHVTGKLETEVQPECFRQRLICLEVKAATLQAAIDSFEIDGWEFRRGVKVRLVSEAMKLERNGEASLFPLPPMGAK